MHPNLQKETFLKETSNIISTPSAFFPLGPHRFPHFLQSYFPLSMLVSFKHLLIFSCLLNKKKVLFKIFGNETVIKFIAG